MLNHVTNMLEIVFNRESTNIRQNVTGLTLSNRKKAKLRLTKQSGWGRRIDGEHE